ncbi:hypothetical protein [Paenibacillus sp. 22594]|uniref:hypothetical protein n=1 Tax=Paenibacillus sp. 22594 TaxID=3453947 RepID=UPI003F826C90
MPKHSLKTSRSSCRSAIQHVIFEQPWGQRVVRVYEPDKYIIELGEPMNVVIKRYYVTGMTLEEVAERSSTPISIVNKPIFHSVSDEMFE